MVIVGRFLWKRSSSSSGILHQDIMSEIEMGQDTYTLQLSSADLAEFGSSPSKFASTSNRKTSRRPSDSENLSELL
jgi:hypothetical protein